MEICKWFIWKTIITLIHMSRLTSFYVIPKNNSTYIVSSTHIRYSPRTIPNLKSFFVHHRLHECYSLVMVLFSFLLSQEINLFSRTHLFSVTYFYTIPWLMVHFFSSFGMVFESILLMHHQIHMDPLWKTYKSFSILFIYTH